MNPLVYIGLAKMLTDAHISTGTGSLLFHNYEPFRELVHRTDSIPALTRAEAVDDCLLYEVVVEGISARCFINEEQAMELQGECRCF